MDIGSFKECKFELLICVIYRGLGVKYSVSDCRVFKLNFIEE